MSTFINLSVIILAHRMDERLENAIKSAQFAQEILINDNTNGGNWKELKQKYRFTVIPHPKPLTDWAATRNEVMKHATQEWVFFLDSDEVITQDSIPEIAAIIHRNFFDGVLIKRSDVFYGKQLKYGEAGDHPIIRMGKKKRLKYYRPVHEEAMVQGPASTSSIVLLHYSHPSVADFLNSVARYAQREAAYRVSQKKHLFIPAMIIFPMGKFVLNYLFKLGFLDGWQGFIYAYLMSMHSFLVRVHHYEQTRVTTR